MVYRFESIYWHTYVSPLSCLQYCFCFKQQTAYELRISDWSSDVGSSDLGIIYLDDIGGPLHTCFRKGGFRHLGFIVSQPSPFSRSRRIKGRFHVIIRKRVDTRLVLNGTIIFLSSKLIGAAASISAASKH